MIKHIKQLLLILSLILVLCCFTSCERSVPDGEYEVISVASYTVIIGSNDDGPIEETRIAFVYMDNGKPQLKSDYYHNLEYVNYKNYIVIGDMNKYIVVHGYRSETEYLYLTQETYDNIFGEVQQ